MFIEIFLGVNIIRLVVVKGFNVWLCIGIIIILGGYFWDIKKDMKVRF